MSNLVYIFKIIVAGDTGVGKTSLVQRFVDGQFLANTKATIGADFSLKHVNLELPETEISIILQIWDMAGEEKFRSVLPYYIQGTQGLILAFATDNKLSFKNLSNWLEVIKKYVNDPVPIVLISTKNDLDKEEDQSNLIESFKEKYKIPFYFETSAKNGQNATHADAKLLARGIG